MRTLFSFLVSLPVLLDAWFTFKGIRNGTTERNRLRKFFIDKLGLHLGTFGVAIVISLFVFVMNHFAQASPNLVFSNLLIFLAFGYVAFYNSHRYKNR